MIIELEIDHTIYYFIFSKTLVVRYQPVL
jgi:hypothetical protein